MTFDGKPSVEVRNTLKRYGYRWSPSGGYWWLRCKSADHHLAATRAVELAEKGNHGTCEKCKAKPGRYRNLGWNEAERLLCDDCCLTGAWHPKTELEASGGFDVDRQHEDDCARRCGL